MRAVLRDGRVVEIRPLKKSDGARKFQEYINEIIVEGAFILLDRPVSLKEERKWLSATVRDEKNRKAVTLVALYNNRVVSVFNAHQGRGNESCNVSFGASVARDFRGVGLGEMMLEMIVKKARQKLKPVNIYLTVVDVNKPARRLYEKVGFRKIARLPKWVKNKGRLHDLLFMRLD